MLAHLNFPKAHWLQIHSTNPLERLNAEIKRRTDVVGIFPNDAAITRLVGALLLEQNDEWQLQRRYLQLEGLQALGDNQPARLSAVMSWSTGSCQYENTIRTPRGGAQPFGDSSLANATDPPPWRGIGRLRPTRKISLNFRSCRWRERS